MDEMITVDQGYEAMYIFLRNFYYRGGESNELGLLLTGMELVDQRKTSDPAYWEDWKTAVKEVLSKS